MFQQRRELMDRTAFELGMSFELDATIRLLPYLEDFRLFRRGRKKRILNCLRLQDPLLENDLYIFDYHFNRGSGKSRKTYRQTVFFVQSKKLGLPEFWMKPETFFYKVGKYLGLQKDIDFAAYPEFSKQYRLEGEDEHYIRASMKPEVLQYFTLNKNWCLEGVNYYLIFYRKNHLIPTKKIKQFYQQGMKLLELLEADPLGLS